MISPNGYGISGCHGRGPGAARERRGSGTAAARAGPVAARERPESGPVAARERPRSGPGAAEGRRRVQGRRAAPPGAAPRRPSRPRTLPPQVPPPHRRIAPPWRPRSTRRTKSGSRQPSAPKNLNMYKHITPSHWLNSSSMLNQQLCKTSSLLHTLRRVKTMYLLLLHFRYVRSSQRVT